MCFQMVRGVSNECKGEKEIFKERRGENKASGNGGRIQLFEVLAVKGFQGANYRDRPPVNYACSPHGLHLLGRVHVHMASFSRGCH